MHEGRYIRGLIVHEHWPARIHTDRSVPHSDTTASNILGCR
jgi:hypothetical protein